MKGQRLWVKLVVLAMCVVLVAGCTSKSATEVKKESTIKVMFHDESYFFQQYGDLFAMKHPDINIEVVNTSSLYNESDENTSYEERFEQLVEKEQPDIVLLNTSNFEDFAIDGKLKELDTLIQRDKYNTETIFPGMIELLKEKGEGKLYGLAPSFHGNVIFYNADLFEKYGIEPPHDGMTWQELFDLARRFPTDGDENTRIYGFGNQYGGLPMDQLASMIASTHGLQQFNTDTMQITINTDSWKQVYKLAQEAMDSGALYNPEGDRFQGGSMEDYYKSQVFMMGRMAMTTSSAYLLQSLKEATDYVKDYKPFKIGLAAGPVDPATPGQTRDLYLGEIFAINANAADVDAAWEFLKFINGDEYAKVKSRTMNNGLLSRMGYSTEFNGQNLDVFYKLKPVISNDNVDYEKIPEKFRMEYYPLVEREMGLVKDKSKSIDEALSTIQTEGQALLEKAVKEKEENDKAGNNVEEVSTSVTVTEN